MTGPELEALLAAAASQPDDVYRRRAFLEGFIRSDLLVVGKIPDGGIVDGVAQQGAELHIATTTLPNGGTRIDVFTTEFALSHAHPQGADFIRLPTRDLMQMTFGTHLMLNPGSDYGKEFLPGEVAGLLDGSIFEPPSLKRHVVEQETQILVGQPSDYPHELVKRLLKVFADAPHIHAAALVQAVRPDENEASLLIGYETDDPEAGLQGVAEVVAVTDTAGRPVDFMPLSRGELLFGKGLFGDIKPFFQRKRGLLSKLFG